MNEVYENIKQLYNNILSYTEYFSVEDIYSIKLNIDNLINVAILKSNDNHNSNLSIYDIYRIKDKIEKEIIVHNEKFLNKKENELKNNEKILNGNLLNKGQLNAILKQEHNELVLSSAGTGKTTLLVGKTKYLLNHLDVEPNNILLLSYTNNAVDNIKERVQKETNKYIETYTFHKFCLEVIKQVENIVPKIYTNETNDLFEMLLKEKCKDDKYFGSVLHYIFSLHFEENEEHFYIKQHYYDYLKYNPPITLKGEKVKSYGELEIANFLFEHNISYIYEQKYVYETNNEEYGIYKPDFYLPDYDIYIEYFGINHNNEVPIYFSSHHNMDATREYIDGIEWKRQIHKKNKTKLIECFYYEKEQKKLLKNLKSNLIKNGVILEKISNENLWNEIVKSKNKILDNFVSLLSSCINLIKSNHISKEQIEYLNNYKSNKNMQHNLIMLEIVWPIYELYETYLKDNHLYDFNDLITKALGYIRENKYVHNYDYVLIDEFQDISLMKIILLNEMRKQKDFSLFCVGDDWQSIYNFNGSNIDIILNIEKYIGLCNIDKGCNLTYRYDKTRASITKQFIIKNKNQFNKDIKTNKDYRNDSIVIIENIYEEDLKKDFLLSLYSLPQNSKIILLGRYDRDKEFLLNIDKMKVKYDNTINKHIVVLLDRQDLEIEFMTIHKSKGIECDYAYILNNRNDKLGFPARIETDCFINLLKQNNDFYRYSEERRLMYVALTRAKEQCFLLNFIENQSEFIEELKELNCKVI